jgi:hypothetical protein
MLRLLDLVFNGVAAVFRPGEPPPDDAQSGVSA